MPLLDNATAVRLGTLPIRVMYRNGVEVWPKIGVQIAAAAVNWYTIGLTIVPPGAGADDYIIKKNGVQIHQGPELTFTDPDKLNPSTTYTYLVEAYRLGVLRSTATSAPTTPARADLGLTATAAAYNQINLAWADPSGGMDSYVLKRNGAQIYAGPAKTFPDPGRSASTKYTYTLDALRGGAVLPPSDTASATTPVRPTVQKTVTLSSVSSTSYSGNANNNQYLPDYTNRQDPRGWIFAGQYIYSNGVNFFGHQKAFWTFSIPAEVRNCISINKVEVSVWMEDIPLNNPAGSNFSLYVHHGSFQTTYPAALPGSTQAFGAFHSMDLNWLGMTEWINVTNYVCPGRTTVKEEFRVNGAHGFAMTGLTNDKSDYGFAIGNPHPNRPRVRFTYTVYA